ncbi:MAG: nitroreductase family protein, partial [Thermoleophilia bacterium]|nr:nitroreductase family protein [Thermoleophilia bacterium]
LEDAPVVIVVFEQAYGVRPDGTKAKHYYVRESVGIAIGFLLHALHRAGLATLTHTPSPMGFLRGLLDRPENERAVVVIPVGYPAAEATVPVIGRKPLEEILVRR